MTAPVVRDMNKMSRMGGGTAIHHDGERVVTVYSNAVKLEIGTCILVLEIPTGPSVANYQGDTFASYRSLGFPGAHRTIRAAVINDEVVAIILPQCRLAG